MIKTLKKFFELRKKRRLEKYKRMKSEILCAIAHNAYKEQTNGVINVPVFQVITQRYNNLGISSPKDLTRVYTNFFLDGMVSGIEL
jgi:hypothetical protein